MPCNNRAPRCRRGPTLRSLRGACVCLSRPSLLLKSTNLPILEDQPQTGNSASSLRRTGSLFQPRLGHYYSCQDGLSDGDFCVSPFSNASRKRRESTVDESLFLPRVQPGTDTLVVKLHRQAPSISSRSVHLVVAAGFREVNGGGGPL